MWRLVLAMTLICPASPAVAQQPKILPTYLNLPLLAGDSILPGGTDESVRLAVTRAPGNASTPYIEQLRSMGWIVSHRHAGEAHVRRGEGEDAICFLITGELIVTADSAKPPDPYVQAAFQKYPCASG